MSSPITNEKVGIYTLKKAIGRGAFGSVYIANDPNDIEYIVKIINLQKVTKEDVNNEVKALGSISNINECSTRGFKNRSVLCLVDAFISGNFYVLVTNYLENVVTLRDYMNEFKKLYFLDTSNVAFIMTKLLNQLEILHRHNIIHGDIKPENIIVQFEESNIENPSQKKIRNIMFIDFGNSCNANMCQLGGTILYMAPELLPKVGSKDFFFKQEFKKTDVWSLGVVFYELLNHVFPFPYEGDRMDTRESGLLPADNELVFLRYLYKYYTDLTKSGVKIFSPYLVEDPRYNVFNEIVDGMLVIDPKKRKFAKHFAKMINMFNFSLLAQRTVRHRPDSPRSRPRTPPSRISTARRESQNGIDSAPLDLLYSRYFDSIPNINKAYTP